MTAIQEFDFEADPAPLAFTLMRNIWPDDPDAPLQERIDFVTALMGDPATSTTELAAWMQRAVQD